MNASVTIPFWLFLLLVIVTSLVAFNRFIFPSVKWFFRKKINRAINELNERLNIQIRPFQLTKRQVLLDRLIHDTELLEFAQELSISDEVPREVLIDKIERYAREIVPSFNAYIYYRIGFWFSKKVAKLFYRVRVRVGKNDHLGDVSKDATIVFVMNHRSNMDYILVSFLVAEKMAISYAVGEWAKVWPLHGLIRSMGAYFVRRNSRNPLYRKVLERYIDMATREGVCQAVFPEGGLSRDGKIRPPKLGFLDYMLRHYDSLRDRDVIFIPVGINYDRVMEDRTLLRSLNPEAKRRSKWFAVKASIKFFWRNMRLAQKHQWKRFGYASVSFSRPISTRDYCQSKNVNFSTLNIDERFVEVEKLATHLMESVEKTVPVVPVVLIAEALLTIGDDWVEKEILVERARNLMNRIEKNGGYSVFPHKEKEFAFNAAVHMLCIRHLLETDENRVRVNSNSLEVLQYYANSIAYWREDVMDKKNDAIKSKLADSDK